MQHNYRHLLGIALANKKDIYHILDLSEQYMLLNQSNFRHSDVLSGKTHVNLFFEPSTRTQASFEIAGKRLNADVMTLPINMSSVHKGETLLDTAETLNAMFPDLLVVRHPCSGAVHLLAQKVKCCVINAGDGCHEHPTQALLDALTIRHAKKCLSGLLIAIVGDIVHSRVARSNILLLKKLGNKVRLIGPRTLVPHALRELGVEIYENMRAGLAGADVVMMLRLQKERMKGAFIPSMREYYHRYGLDEEKLAYAQKDAIVMHPGPINRGIEIDGILADDVKRSVIYKQVEIGVAVRMAVMDFLVNH